MLQLARFMKAQYALLDAGTIGRSKPGQTVAGLKYLDEAIARLLVWSMPLEALQEFLNFLRVRDC